MLLGTNASGMFVPGVEGSNSGKEVRKGMFIDKNGREVKSNEACPVCKDVYLQPDSTYAGPGLEKACLYCPACEETIAVDPQVIRVG